MRIYYAMQEIKVLSVVLGIIALYGCASVGTPIASQNIPKIHKGVTTEAQLVQMFGAPMDKSLSTSGKTVDTWTYSAAQAKGTSFIPLAGAFVGGTNMQLSKLQAIIGKDGRVEDYLFNQTHYDINNFAGSN
jgi:hypothetical protein